MNEEHGDKMTESKRYYGFFSAKTVDQGMGSYWYLRPDGSRVQVTGVYLDPEGSEYHWPDKQSVGEVTRYAGECSPTAEYLKPIFLPRGYGDRVAQQQPPAPGAAEGPGG